MYFVHECEGKEDIQHQKIISLPIHFVYVFFFQGPVDSQKKRYYFGNLFLYLMYVINTYDFNIFSCYCLFQRQQGLMPALKSTSEYRAGWGNAAMGNISLSNWEVKCQMW